VSACFPVGAPSALDHAKAARMHLREAIKAGAVGCVDLADELARRIRSAERVERQLRKRKERRA
jgi:hypothetical protein